MRPGPTSPCSSSCKPTFSFVSGTPPDVALRNSRYVNRDREVTKRLVQHAEERGCKGLFITVDAPQLGRREKVRIRPMPLSRPSAHACRRPGHAAKIRGRGSGGTDQDRPAGRPVARRCQSYHRSSHSHHFPDTKLTLTIVVHRPGPEMG